jgi:hypothetical protein
MNKKNFLYKVIGLGVGRSPTLTTSPLPLKEGGWGIVGIKNE